MATFAPAALCGRRTPSPRAALDRVVAPASTSYGGVGPARGARAVARVAPTRLERWWSPRRPPPPPRPRSTPPAPRAAYASSPPPPAPGDGAGAGGGFGAGPPPPRRPPPRRPPPTNEELPVRVTVECAMLSALTGLLFHLSTLLRVDAYFGALFPMPVVIAAARHGNKAARRVATVTAMLLFVISGPLRSSNYLFLHGLMAIALGVAWNARCTWWVTVPLSALTRSLGIFASLGLSSLILRENVMQLLVNQMYGLLDQIAANIGATFMPSVGWVWAIALFFILLNSLSYVAVLHAVYAIVLRAVGGVPEDFVNAPERVKKMLGVPPYGPQSR